MEKVTIVLDEEVAQWVRVQAARAGTSVSSLVSMLLHERMLEDPANEVAMEQLPSGQPISLSGADAYPSRESLHDRAGLRSS